MSLTSTRQRCRPKVKKYSLMFSWVQAEQGWLKGVSEKQIKGDFILSGNCHHSNHTLPCMESSSKSFHCVSFPCSFCYNRYVWRTLAAVNCGSTGLFPMGLCAVFPHRYLFLHDVKSASHGFEIYSTKLAVHTRSSSWKLCYWAFPRASGRSNLWSRETPNLPYSVLSHQ